MFNAERSGFDCNAEHCSQDGNTFLFLRSTLERRDGKSSSFQCSTLERRGTALRWVRMEKGLICMTCSTRSVRASTATQSIAARMGIPSCSYVPRWNAGMGNPPRSNVLRWNAGVLALRWARRKKGLICMTCSTRSVRVSTAMQSIAARYIAVRKQKNKKTLRLCLILLPLTTSSICI